MRKTITLCGSTVEYNLEIKNVKNINLRIHRDGRVCVSANRYVAQEHIDAFLTLNSGFILETLKRYQKQREAGDGMSAGRERSWQDGDVLYLLGNPYRLKIIPGDRDRVDAADGILTVMQKDVNDAERRKRMLDRFLTQRCRDEVEALSRKHYPYFEQLGVVWPQIKVRSMVSRWGSCHPVKHILTFARQLVEVPEPCMEYVVVHEFAHFVHPDHSPRFHAFLDTVMPDWKRRKDLLNSRSWLRGTMTGSES